jgi:hypothetical protein
MTSVASLGRAAARVAGLQDGVGGLFPTPGRALISALKSRDVAFWHFCDLVCHSPSVGI